jgi:hypothetical protein
MSEYDKLSIFEVLALIKAYMGNLSTHPDWLGTGHVEAIGKLLARKNEIEAQEKLNKAA